MIGVLTLNWIQSYFLHPNAMWFHTPKSVFKRVEGLEYLIKCDYKISKLPIKLSNFHKQILQYWKIMFTHNFTPYGSTLWIAIAINRKSLFKKEWNEREVLFIVDLFDEAGQFLE